MLWSKPKIRIVFLQRAAEGDRVGLKYKICRCFETVKGDMKSPANMLIFMRWCQVLAGDISLKMRAGGEWRASGDRDFIIHGSVPFL